jgi:hypothetical protein
LINRTIPPMSAAGYRLLPVPIDKRAVAPETLGIDPSPTHWKAHQEWPETRCRGSADVQTRMG